LPPAGRSPLLDEEQSNGYGDHSPLLNKQESKVLSRSHAVVLIDTMGANVFVQNLKLDATFFIYA
jgi:hypothetical protein